MRHVSQFREIGPAHEFRCSGCGKVLKRRTPRVWIVSFCEKAGRAIRCYRTRSFPITSSRKRVGTWVRLKHRVRSGPQKAWIVVERPGVARGAVFLSHPLDGMQWWNKRDLVACEPPKTGPDRSRT